jgi:branched-chain amino acid transport system permease protein
MFDIPLQVLLGQITIGLVNGCFYAILSLGLALIFGLLNVINFAHGALYMLGAFGVYLAMQKLGVNYWWSLLLVPIVVGIFGALVERLLLRRLIGLDHLYGLLFTFGLALVLEGIFRDIYGSAGLPDLPGLDRRRVTGRMFCNLVPDRAHTSGLLSACGNRELEDGPGARH